MGDAALDSTVAGSGANSYVSLAFAYSYFADTLEATEWGSFDLALRADALKMATALIDKLDFMGEAYDRQTPQARKFPRDTDTAATDAPEIPDGVEYATCELALHWLRWLRDDGEVGNPHEMPRSVKKLLNPFLIEKLDLELGKPRSTGSR